jgi:H+-translocating NAD(P) transhydrogenase subunit alpha
MPPRATDLLAKSGVKLLVEASAGLEAGFPDSEYIERKVCIAHSRKELFEASDILAMVRTAGANPDALRLDRELYRSGQVVAGFAEPLSAPEAAAEMAAWGVTLFALELMPRITRAQSMDALSSMATIVGYKAVLLAAGALPRMFPLLMTAAGTIAPARVFVLGAGVAGLQAIATARRLGAVVSGYDVRSAVREQVESLGGKFIQMELKAEEGQGGYALAMDETFYRRQRELLTEVVRESEVVITTAAVPGKKAPVLITRGMVEGMAAGSVVVDLAAERGGNCELTRPGEAVVHGGVRILGPLNLASEVPYHASQMYGRNLATFLKHLIHDGELRIDGTDEITRETLVARGGELVHAQLRPAHLSEAR